ncbi:MarR family winged helix-turn-helix transcriptional regulator [Dehalococcoides sp.]|uniref:MarR family winged helix-turn-helix transcriptional regulator n=1 Tax=Dehalococcoides sp. TaxID=1966486 RepID=UPI002ACB18FD|nr:MarR family transcriptional regulator [Dehalococcoides sp.]
MTNQTDLSIELGHYLTVLISHTQHLEFKKWSRELAKVGLSWQQFAVLHEIMVFDGIPTPHTIAKKMVFEAHTISSIITRMERDGLVVKINDLKYKNMVRIEPTEKAKSMMEAAWKTLRGLDDFWFSCLTRDEALQLANYLEKIRNFNISSIYNDEKNLTPYTIKTIDK